MTEGPKKPSLDELGKRIKEARARADHSRGKRDEESARSDNQGLSFALKVGTELVASLIVGVGIGYFLDQWLGTGPWFLIVFFFLGAAAGIMGVYRVASGYGLAVGYKKPDEKDNGTNERGPDSE